TTAMSLAFMMQRLEGGLVAPVAGYLFDRLGPRKIGLVGTFVSASGFLLMTRIHSLPLFYTSYLMIALGFSFGLGGVGRAVIANWFIRLRGRAMAGQMVGFGLSGSIAPLMVVLINHFGWRNTLLASGIGLLVIGIPASLIMVHRPEDKGLLPDGVATAAEAAEKRAKARSASKDGGNEVDFTAKQAVSTVAFWAMAVGFTMGNFGQSSLMVYEMPALKSAGISRETAALVITAITLTSVAGRLGFGWLMDLHSKRLTAAATIGLQSVGILLFGLLFLRPHLASAALPPLLRPRLRRHHSDPSCYAG
ncbi:MAG: MFS transporter, partial [Chloroflexi bacterium]|nr:MFS transporter [Chloroflexota bacterium]